jgi:hypothetical protein
MSDVRPDIDLSALARAPAAPVAPPKRRKLRIIVPLLLLAGFAAVLVSTLGDFFAGVTQVTVVRPQLAEGVAAAGGATLRAAAGPSPIRSRSATALTAGPSSKWSLKRRLSIPAIRSPRSSTTWHASTSIRRTLRSRAPLRSSRRRGRARQRPRES